MEADSPRNEAIACAIALVMLVTVTACWPRPTPMDRSEVAGEYYRDFIGGWENLRLHEDGTYEETFRFKPAVDVHGTVVRWDATYRNSGRWTYVGKEGEPTIMLQQALLYPMTQPPQPVDWTLKARRTKNGGLILYWVNDPDGYIDVEKRRGPSMPPTTPTGPT